MLAAARREQRVHPVADRGGPERRLRRPRMLLVDAVAAADPRDELRIEPENLRKPLPIALLRRIGGQGEKRTLLAIVKARICIVPPCVSGTSTRTVVGRRPLREQFESAA